MSARGKEPGGMGTEEVTQVKCCATCKESWVFANVRRCRPLRKSVKRDDGQDCERYEEKKEVVRWPTCSN